MTLPFSKKLTAATTTFACITAAKNAQRLIQSPENLSALGFVYGKLVAAHQMLRASQESAVMLDEAIAAASQQINALNELVQPMNGAEWASIKAAVANAVTAIAQVRS